MTAPEQSPAVESRCTIAEGFPEHCPREGVYRTTWDNGDEALLCVEHAARVRATSDDLTQMHGPGREAS